MTNMKRTAIVPAALALFLLSAAMALPVSCAHVPTPGQFISCMADQKDEALLATAIEQILSGDGYGPALDALYAVAPDVVKCLLQREGAKKGAGPADELRARRAREYLESHGLADLTVRHSMDFTIFKKGGGLQPAPRVGELPSSKAGGDSSPSVGSGPTPGHPVLTEI